MRKLIAGMQMSVDGKVEGPDGYADWITSWEDTFDLPSDIDACVLGAGMYPGYEQYWSAVAASPNAALPSTGAPPTPREVAYAEFAVRTPHYVLSKSLSTAAWPHTRFLHGAEDVLALKQQAGGSIFLTGGARTVASLIDAGAVDELRLTLHPLIAGKGLALFGATQNRRQLRLTEAKPLEHGRLALFYEVR